VGVEVHVSAGELAHVTGGEPLHFVSAVAALSSTIDEVGGGVALGSTSGLLPAAPKSFRNISEITRCY